MDKAAWIAWANKIEKMAQDHELRLEMMAERIARLEADRHQAPSTGQARGPFPKTEAELTAAGYTFSGKGTCKACQAELEWWITPKGAATPLDPGTMESHFKTCPEADKFRKPRNEP